MADNAYLFPNRAAHAARRLALLAELFDAWTFRHLDACGAGPGMRCWEVGAGGPSVPRWLAARAGDHGQVLATDLDPSLLGDLPPNVEVRRHDLVIDPPPAGGFDLVHTRLVLVHVSDRERALAAMVAAARPGGWIVVEDADPGLQPLACLQAGEAAERANRIRRGFRALLAARGADLSWGRSLPDRLRAAGLDRVTADGYLAFGVPACTELEIATVAMLRDAAVAAGHTTAAEIDAHLASITAGEIDLAQPVLVSAWGQRPPARSSDTAGTGRSDPAAANPAAANPAAATRRRQTRPRRQSRQRTSAAS